MRIARPRPAPIALPPVAVIAAIVAIGATFVFAGTCVARRALRGDAATIAARQSTTMADAFGLGGLGGLSYNSDGAALPSPVEHNQIVTYYGNPYTPSMGILGEHSPEAAADLLAARAEQFRAIPGAHVLPALHLVYAVAQSQPGSDSHSLQYLDDRTVRQFIDLARRRGFIVILDLQIGHSDALAEVERIAPYLREPDVFVALDPEFALPAGTKPGEKIGSIGASDINDVQAYLVWLTASARVPKKMLIVHQFETGMITDASLIDKRDDVDLVIDMDGYGPADIKEVKYQRYGAAEYAPYGGIKVFLEHDPDPLTEQQLMSMQPRPALIVYQ